MAWPPTIHGDVREQVARIVGPYLDLFGTADIGTGSGDNNTDPPRRILTNIWSSLDGGTLTASNPGDIVGLQNTVHFFGDYTNEHNEGWSSSPGFLFGSNDYITTGDATGDLAGATVLLARLVESHLMSPGADLDQFYALQTDQGVHASATDSHVGRMASLFINRPYKEAGATGAVVDDMYAIYAVTPTAGDATNVWGIYVEGYAPSYFGGPLQGSIDPSHPTDANLKYGVLFSKGGHFGEIDNNPGSVFGAKAFADADVVGWIQGRGGQSGDLLRLGNDTTIYTRFDKNGRLGQRIDWAPADADIVNGEIFMWVTPTAGAMKLNLKGKDAGGTVRTAQVSLA